MGIQGTVGGHWEKKQPSQKEGFMHRETRKYVWDNWVGTGGELKLII